MDYLLKDPDEMSPGERLDALAEVLAEGFVYLAANGLLDDVLGKVAEAGQGESAKKAAESPCFPAEHRLSFLPDKGGGPSE
ncbi:MAG: hypothetical protein HY748_00925 [Elusimicrobia bacterium]|nr:hypothetical protein [Elusimicrobiota bacterium]